MKKNKPLIKKTAPLLLAFTLLLTTGCDSFDLVQQSDEVKLIQVRVNAEPLTGGITNFEGYTLTFKDVKYGNVHTFKLTNEGSTPVSIIPGIYQIDVNGEYTDSNNDTYYIQGNKVNFPIIEEGASIDISLHAIWKSDLLFKEIFYAGTSKFYFRNQFYELYNNSSDKTIYLDGIYFANLVPIIATTKLPLWPEEDGDRYVYGDRVWQFPGNGTDYPLQPGESCVIAQFAANHKLPQYNPNSPVDCSSAEFEFHMYHKNSPDQPAINMEHVFQNGQQGIGGRPFYLTSVFGGAYVIFKPLLGEPYDPVNNSSLHTKDLSSTMTTLYAKIPITYILDGVEAGHNENMLTAKRMTAAIDRGMTFVGATYNSLGVARKKIGERADGTPILQDTNDSYEDFDRGVVPQFRRYGAKMPSWNHTLSGK